MILLLAVHCIEESQCITCMHIGTTSYMTLVRITMFSDTEIS